MQLKRTISVGGALWASLVSVSSVWGQFGVPISAPVSLNTNAATDTAIDGFGPQLATDGQGNWVTVWTSATNTAATDGDIMVARSADDGATWSAPATLNSNAAPSGRSDRWAELVTDRLGNWLAAWVSSDTLGGTIGLDADILYARSVDNGATWTTAAPLNTTAATDAGADEFARIATDGLGNWVAVWDSTDDLSGTIGTDNDILVARSTDGGATWTAAAPLNTNAATDAADDGTADIATDGLGTWLAVWGSFNDPGPLGGDHDLLYARSVDNGVTWTAPAPLNTNASTDSGNDLHPLIVTDGGGAWVTVWESRDDLGGTIGLDKDILFARSEDDGTTWTAPAPLHANADTDTGTDEFPKAATDGHGNWVVVWASSGDLGGAIGTDFDVLIARSVNGGAAWTSLTLLNTNAADDSGNDTSPHIATDGLGHWRAVWGSSEDLGGTIGADGDILTAEFQIGGAIPAVRFWGLAAMVVVLTILGSIVLSRHGRRSATVSSAPRPVAAIAASVGGD